MLHSEVSFGQIPWLKERSWTVIYAFQTFNFSKIVTAFLEGECFSGMEASTFDFDNFVNESKEKDLDDLFKDRFTEVMFFTWWKIRFE